MRSSLPPINQAVGTDKEKFDDLALTSANGPVGKVDVKFPAIRLPQAMHPQRGVVRVFSQEAELFVDLLLDLPGKFFVILLERGGGGQLLSH